MIGWILAVGGMVCLAITLIPLLLFPVMSAMTSFQAQRRGFDFSVTTVHFTPVYFIVVAIGICALIAGACMLKAHAMRP